MHKILQATFVVVKSFGPYCNLYIWKEWVGFDLRGPVRTRIISPYFFRKTFRIVRILLLFCFSPRLSILAVMPAHSQIRSDWYYHYHLKRSLLLYHPSWNTWIICLGVKAKEDISNPSHHLEDRNLWMLGVLQQDTARYSKIKHNIILEYIHYTWKSGYYSNSIVYCSTGILHYGDIVHGSHIDFTSWLKMYPFRDDLHHGYFPVKALFGCPL